MQSIKCREIWVPYKGYSDNHYTLKINGLVSREVIQIICCMTVVHCDQLPCLLGGQYWLGGKLKKNIRSIRREKNKHFSLGE